jgi:type IV pilus assembly protein PilM
MKMPLLLVQIDENFLSLNLYDKGILLFSRFTSIDAADYDDPEDYIFDAVNENIFRMQQFQRARDSENPIQNVVFYGETTEYTRLSGELERQDVTASLLGIPSAVGGYENFDFQSYANAIGAMFKSNRDIERINLLEINAAQGKTESGMSFVLGWAGAGVLSAVIIAGIYIIFMVQVNSVQLKIDSVDAWLNSADTQSKVAMVDDAQSRADKIAKYATEIQTAADNYNTKPVLTWDVYENIIANETGTDGVLDARVIELAFADGEFQMSCKSADSEGPSRFIQNMYEQNIFRNIVYTGYSYTAGNTDDNGITTPASYNFDVTFNLPPNPVADAGAVTDAADTAGEAGSTTSDGEATAQ